MAKQIKGSGWLLTSLGIALLVLSWVLAPSTLQAEPVVSGCAGDSCLTGSPNYCNPFRDEFGHIIGCISSGQPCATWNPLCRTCGCGYDVDRDVCTCISGL